MVVGHMAERIKNAQVKLRGPDGRVTTISPCTVRIIADTAGIAYKKDGELHQIITHLSNIYVYTSQRPTGEEPIEFFEEMKDATVL
jgi:hypothetical protein